MNGKNAKIGGFGAVRALAVEEGILFYFGFTNGTACRYLMDIISLGEKFPPSKHKLVTKCYRTIYGDQLPSL